MSLKSTGSTIWIEITEIELSVEKVYAWSVLDNCGAVVLFSGTVRDFSDGRPGVTKLSYEAYESVAFDRMNDLANRVLTEFVGIGRVAVIHRLGEMAPGDSTVIISVSAAHREQAYEASRFLIDTLKRSVPIWKKESWQGGSDWALGANSVKDI
ncbi:MAG: molybdenum cofactor biosynthesis protein MoaE [Acidimicrobiaceae bacterium]|nr:molybdenum cofactor biosynthesis protein MoaE [Acidimicrobiaceae bacterium]